MPKTEQDPLTRNGRRCAQVITQSTRITPNETDVNSSNLPPPLVWICQKETDTNYKSFLYKIKQKIWETSDVLRVVTLTHVFYRQLISSNIPHNATYPKRQMFSGKIF